ncbi:MAG: hypothetical protein JNM68_00145 [Dinghuibacter sp.]|nr:hypothetical protein [Dinghuibacter sp.]
MKKMFAGLVALTIIAGSCKKQDSETGTSPLTAERETPVTEACGSKYLNLVIDAAGGGQSYLYRVDNSPSNPPVLVSFIGQIGNVTFMTGISYDPASGVGFGVTGNAGSNPNSLVKFDVNIPSNFGVTPLLATFPINLSDIERNPWNGRYYAINRAVANNNSLVIVDINTGVVTQLPSSTGQPLRGLAMDPGGKIYVMRTVAGGNGRVSVIDPTTGAVIPPFNQCPYPGVISPGGLANAEMGLHFDDICTNLLVTGNFTGTNIQLTDGYPACLGPAAYTALPNSLRPTVDFSRLY